MQLKNSELFEDLRESEVEALLQISREANFKKDNILFYEGDQPETLYFLMHGIVRIYKVDQKGNDVVLHFIQAPSLIAELAHMQHICYPATAVCETNCQFLAICYEEFEKEFLKNPVISFKIITSLCKKIMNLERVITRNLTMDSFARLSKFLLENESLLSSLSHRKIAAILNITPETLSRNLSFMKSKGLVEVEKRRISILDHEALKQNFTDL